MRHSIKRWLDWVMTDLLPLARPRPAGQPIHLRYEKSGLSLHGPPIPWNADSVVVELVMKLPANARQRTDFTLRLPGREAVPAELIRKDDRHDGLFRVFFRLPTPTATATAEVLWKHRLLTPVFLPIQTPDEFLAGLQLGTPTVSVRIGNRNVAANTFIAVQCRGLTAAAVIKSPTGLAPLADLGLSVLFRAERFGVEDAVPVPLSASQMAAKEALVTASPPKFPRQAGEYAITWRVGDRRLLTQRVTAVSTARFAQSLRIADARFVVEEPGGLKASRQPPTGSPSRVGPCFAVASREPGAAGLVELEATVQLPGAVSPPVLMKQAVLVTDGPTLFLPGLLDPAEAAQVSGFELRHKSRVLGVLSFRPVPAASFTAEGGFKPPPDFAWSNAADEELTERLLKLMQQEGK